MSKPLIYNYERSGLHFKTTATKERANWFSWRIEVAEDPKVLRRIEEVEYILHPTFPERIRRTDDSESRFALETEGWGGFNIAVNVYYKNGDEVNVTVPLKLE